MALLQAPGYANDDLTIHIRTKARYQYSYIEAAVIGIGSETLEIGSFGSYFYNGVADAKLPALFGGYPISHESKMKKHIFKITLEEATQETIVVSVYKDMVAVSVENASNARFAESVGMMGSYREGSMLARDGATIMEDHSVFGQEWQVLPSEPQLFQTASRYMNQGCAPPTVGTAEQRRLGEAGVEQKAAEEACAHHGEGQLKDMCVFDVMAMGDLEVASVHGTF